MDTGLRQAGFSNCGGCGLRSWRVSGASENKPVLWPTGLGVPRGMCDLPRSGSNLCLLHWKAGFVLLSHLKFPPDSYLISVKYVQGMNTVKDPKLILICSIEQETTDLNDTNRTQ